MKNFIYSNESDILNCLSNYETFDKYVCELQEDFQKALSNLSGYCQNSNLSKIYLYFFPKRSSFYSLDKFNQLNSLITNADDVKVVLDSYYIAKNIKKKPISFITLDKLHILSKKDKIEYILKEIEIYNFVKLTL